MKSDLINLDELRNLYGEDSVRELLDMSLKEARGLIDGLRSSVPRHDASAVGQDAHQLKGMSATMTMTRVADLSYKLEQCAKNDAWDDSQSLLQNIESSFAELEEFLKKTLV
jgi:HPt (histidine-containing phosphotransfer) domain-containing protein